MRGQSMKRFNEIPFDSAFENIAGYIGCGHYGLAFTASDGWKKALSRKVGITQRDINDEIYVSADGVQNGHRYIAFVSDEVFIVEIAELRRMMLKDLEDLEEC